MAAWAKFVIGFNAIHVLSTAVADEQGDRGERLFTLNVCAELHHGLNSFCFLTDHALSLQSRSASVNPLVQIFFDFFPSQHQARFPHLPQPTHIHKSAYMYQCTLCFPQPPQIRFRNRKDRCTEKHCSFFHSIEKAVALTDIIGNRQPQTLFFLQRFFPVQISCQNFWHGFRLAK
jgi:hypothetical protein